MTKAVFFDVDGTLVSFQTHRLSPAVLDALHQLRAQGIKLFISTGRHPKMLSYIQSVFSFDGFITLSGQYCFCGDQVLHRTCIEPRGVEQLVHAAQGAQFPCIFLEEDYIYINHIDEKTKQFVVDLDLPLPPVDNPGRALGQNLFQAIAFLTRKEEHLLLDQAPNLKTTRWHPHFLDVIPSAGGKDKGMDVLLSHFHIPREQTMAFGDGENDLSMLIHAGIGIAMGSASDRVKAGADWTTGTAEEDGILAGLAHFGLI